MPKFNKVLAFEGEWEFGPDHGVLTDRTTIRTILETLKNYYSSVKEFDSIPGENDTKKELKKAWKELKKAGEDEFRFIHRRTATKEGLYYYLEKCLGDNADKGINKYNVIMFEFHGAKGSIWINSAKDKKTPTEDTETPTKDTEAQREDGEFSIESFGEELQEKFGKSCFKGKVVYFGSCETALDKESIKEFKKQTGASAVIAFTKTINWIESAAFELILLDWLSHYAQPKRVKDSIEEFYPRFSKNLGMHFEI